MKLTLLCDVGLELAEEHCYSREKLVLFWDSKMAKQHPVLKSQMSGKIYLFSFSCYSFEDTVTNFDQQRNFDFMQNFKGSVFSDCSSWCKICSLPVKNGLMQFFRLKQHLFIS